MYHLLNRNAFYIATPHLHIKVEHRGLMIFGFIRDTRPKHDLGLHSFHTFLEIINM